jgi:perosamine synthetase
MSRCAGVAIEIPVAKPSLVPEDAEAAARVILSGWVTQGPEVLAFEREFAAYTGARHAIAVSNCTAALHVALIAVGVKPGDEVITVSHSFIATANAVRYCAAVPVFIDIELPTFNIDPELIEAAISPRTRAILCVHQIGMPCNLPTILPIARRHGLKVVEDGACAAGSEIQIDGSWQRIGRPCGDVCCFSFHPRKVITTGDGGMVTTNNERLESAIRRLRQHGMSISDAVRHNSSEVLFEDYVSIGYNYRLSDIQAAVGREQLKRMDAIITERRKLADHYRVLLEHITGLVVPVDSSWTRSNWQSFCVLLPKAANQRAVMQHMLDLGIATRRGVMCSHREPAYADTPVRYPLLQSEAAQDRGILLPLYQGMSGGDQERVVAALEQALARC